MEKIISPQNSQGDLCQSIINQKRNVLQRTIIPVHIRLKINPVLMIDSVTHNRRDLKVCRFFKNCIDDPVDFPLSSLFSLEEFTGSHQNIVHFLRHPEFFQLRGRTGVDTAYHNKDTIISAFDSWFNDLSCKCCCEHARIDSKDLLAALDTGFRNHIKVFLRHAVQYDYPIAVFLAVPDLFRQSTATGHHLTHLNGSHFIPAPFTKEADYF